MNLRPDISIFPLDGDVVVFSEEAQCLVGLNASAAFLVEELRAGIPAAKIAETLSAEGIAPPGEAAQWVANTLEALRSQGMLQGGPAAQMPELYEDKRLAREIAKVRPYAPFKPVAERRYRLLNACAHIRFGKPSQVRLVDAVIGHLAVEDTAEPTVVIDLAGIRMEDDHVHSYVYVDREPFGYAPMLSRLGPLVKAALWRAAVNSYDFLFYVHAGVVGTGRSCVLLPAAPGSGKSSLTAALTSRGYRYYSDEIALIGRETFTVPPVPLALCVKSTGWDLIARYFPQVASLPSHGRGDGKVVRYIPPPAHALRQPARPVGHIVFPRYLEGAATELKPVARADALRRLMGECLALRQRLDKSNVTEIIDWIAKIDCFELPFSSLEEAVELIAAKIGPVESPALTSA